MQAFAVTDFEDAISEIISRLCFCDIILFEIHTYPSDLLPDINKIKVKTSGS